MPDHHDASTIAALRQRIAKLQRERQDERADEKTNTRRLNARVQELIGEKERLQEGLLVAQQDLENANYAVAQSSDELRELREANKTFNGMCAENNQLKDEVERLQDKLDEKREEEPWRTNRSLLRTINDLQTRLSSEGVAALEKSNRLLRSQRDKAQAQPQTHFTPSLLGEKFSCLKGFKEGCEFMHSAMQGVK